jgi:predicted nucleic acid-binding protein
MFYVDTSVLVSFLTNEADAPRVALWLRSDPEREFVISDWTVTEFSSALGVKVRTGRLLPGEHPLVIAEFNRLTAGAFPALPVSSLHFHTAAKFANRHDLGLKAGDALHLAIALEAGATLATLDQRLAAAGPHFGALTQLV